MFTPDHVETEDALKRGTPTASGVQLMLYVNESGLYAPSGMINQWVSRGRVVRDDLRGVFVKNHQ